MDPKKIVLVLIAILVVLPRLAGVWVDYLWFDSLGYLSVFTKILTTKIALGIIAFLITTPFIWFNLKLAGKNIDLEDLRLKARLQGFEFFGFASVLAGLGSALLLSPQWMKVLKFFNSTSFGKVDPVFSKDLSFYFFRLPFWELSLNYLLGLFLLSSSIAGIFYALVYQKKKETELDENEVLEKAKRHLFPLAGILFFLLAARVYIGKYYILLSGRGAVFGAAYTDLHVTLPLVLIVSFLCAATGALLLVNLKIKKLKLSAIGLVSILVVAIVGGLASGLVQSYKVEPNEFDLEKKYIQRNINHTLRAYDLGEINEKGFLANYNLTHNEVEKRNETVKNIRLWDYRALKDTYSQLQLIRTYYNFNDVDVDRYHLNSNYEQVMLSAREMSQENLPSQADTWVNRHLVYTHGSGVVMSPVTEISEQGLPIFYLKDIPPTKTDSTPSDGLEVRSPDIYYGEGSKDFVITDTGTREFDYPKGDKNVYSSYNGSGGVSIGGFVKKLAMALNFGDIKILVSGALRPDSRILFHRNIRERTGKIAPFLQYDGDPYPVVNAEGRIEWILDSYTVSDSYPYSEPFNGFNYIRNSVKVTIDAYSGKVNYYIVDREPLINTYEKIFPGLFQDFGEMPDRMKKHIRYPEDLFTVQSKIYSTYHMHDPQVFYNKEDKWTVPNEVYRGTSQPVEPYYVTLKLPGENETQFMLIRPFTPEGKDNMIAWMGAKSDMPDYGEKIVYEFSKQRLIYGPQQIESRISQNTEISQQITLWSQSGSRVIRGNLLVIPLEDSLLYVEPLFLKSSENSIPELKRVIVAFGDKIAMEPTLRGSLGEIFLGENRTGVQEPPSEDTQEEGPQIPQQELLQKAKNHYDRSREYLKEGNFSAYADEIEKLGDILEKLNS